ncbi:phenol hydroxylase [Nitrogeniibacter mangrovi]|uniref:Phenol hydroxylase n=1 Tax=Nitrogeniibacter mangrovi TaxID=2016596 RepID=A0A6C1B3R4_9RHOO|nr:phenol hydroxylase [Nitrogeniibacter mangrovi]QID17629.1 phenol hydroxylase [Nitrogeniibacter mangrovi]
MQMDLRTVSIQPLRHTYSNIARRFGDKPASRYQEGTYDLQATANFQYRPTWDPDHEIFDPARTRIKMEDWYAFKDPRQFYYGAYTLARAKQQDAAEANLSFVESHNLVGTLGDELRDRALRLLLPLRHVAWGGNLNNASVCAYGYGTAFTQPFIYYAMDQLAVAQYLTRVGLLLGDETSLESAKEAWMSADVWQGLRRYVEDTFVLKDPYELFVAQDVALDGLLYPMVFDAIVGGVFAAQGGTPIALATQFMTDWFGETKRWADATIKTAASESPENKALVEQWVTHWRDRAAAALRPVAQIAVAEGADELIAEQVEQFNARMAKAGIKV